MADNFRIRDGSISRQEDVNLSVRENAKENLFYKDIKQFVNNKFRDIDFIGNAIGDIFAILDNTLFVKRLPIGKQDDLLTTNKGIPSWRKIGLLSPSHNDTTTGSPVKGDLIAGKLNSSTLWTKLPIGTNTYVLMPDSTNAYGMKWDKLLDLDGIEFGMFITQQTLANDTIKVETAGVYWVNGRRISKNPISSIVVPAAHATLYRIDVVQGDTSGTITIRQGLTSLLTDLLPLPPAPDPNNTLLAYIFRRPTKNNIFLDDNGTDSFLYGRHGINNLEIRTFTNMSGFLIDSSSFMSITDMHTAFYLTSPRFIKMQFDGAYIVSSANTEGQVAIMIDGNEAITRDIRDIGRSSALGGGSFLVAPKIRFAAGAHKIVGRGRTKVSGTITLVGVQRQMLVEGTLKS